MTSGERADQLFSDAGEIADEMRTALARGRWNLAARRAQEVVELMIKGLLNELGVEAPRLHDPVPAFVDVVRARGIEIDAGLLARLVELSRWLAEIRAPAFYQEIRVEEARAREAVDDADQVLGFGRDLVVRLRNKRS